MDTKANQHQFSLLYLNRRYDFEMGAFANQHMEYLFLSHCYRWLVNKGVLVFVIPQKAIDSCTAILSSHFSKITVCLLPDPESVKYRQVVVFAVHSKVDARAQESQRRYLEQCARQLSSLWILETAPQFAVRQRLQPRSNMRDFPSAGWRLSARDRTPGCRSVPLFSFGPGVQDARPLTPLQRPVWTALYCRLVEWCLWRRRGAAYRPLALHQALRREG